jgi:putative transposase
LYQIKKLLVHIKFKKAIQSRNPSEGLIFHSDQVSQYASDEFKQVLSGIEARQSMSRKGDCWDNAVAESFFKTFKSELIYWENFKSRSEAELKIFEYYLSILRLFIIDKDCTRR